MKASTRTLFAEGLVIVVSILSAFALDTWWDGRSERAEERATLHALRVEFAVGRESVEERQGFQQRILQSVGSVTDSLDAALTRGDLQVALPDTAVGLAYIPPTTSVTLGTLDGLVASGRLGIITDPELRAALGSWGNSLGELNEEEEDLRDLAYGQMDEALREVMNTNGLWQVADELFDETLEPQEMDRSRAVPVTTEVLGVFHLRRSILTHAMDEFVSLLEEIDHIVALIDRSL